MKERDGIGVLKYEMEKLQKKNLSLQYRLAVLQKHTGTLRFELQRLPRQYECVIKALVQENAYLLECCADAEAQLRDALNEVEELRNKV